MTESDDTFSGSFAGEEPAHAAQPAAVPRYQRQKPANPRTTAIVFGSIALACFVGGVLCITLSQTSSVHVVGFTLCLFGAFSVFGILNAGRQFR